MTEALNKQFLNWHHVLSLVETGNLTTVLEIIVIHNFGKMFATETEVKLLLSLQISR